MSHIPVLLKQVIEYLDPKPGDLVIDGTINGGGHAKEILKKISPGGTLQGIDWDENLVQGTRAELTSRESKVVLVCDNYADFLEKFASRPAPSRADGLLLDLGFSTDQLESSGRGFSFSKDEPLIMTYSKKQKPVAEIIRELSEKDLSDIIFKLSGERFSRRIAKAIKATSKKERVISSQRLAEIIRYVVPKNYERGSGRTKSRIDPATRTFQALRIYANDELGNLERALVKIPDVLKSHGRAVIISFHSLEDALIKDSFRKMEKDKLVKILTKKPVAPDPEEISNNPKSRSAKLRALERI